MTKRYIAQFQRGGFPELYVVADTFETPWVPVSDPQPHHDALEEAEARNNGTYGKPVGIEELHAALQSGWLGGLTFSPIKA